MNWLTKILDKFFVTKPLKTEKELFFTGLCQHINQTADGKRIGRCLRSLYNGRCSVHGDQ